MKNLLLSTAAAVTVLAAATMANAADMAPAPSVYDWSGVYIGLNAGVAWSNSEVDGRVRCSSDGSVDADAFCDDFSSYADDLRQGVDDSGGVFTGGAMIGANWQWESLVLGVEADVNYANFGDSNSRDLSDLANEYFQSEDIVASSRASYDADWWGTVRARAGFAVDNWLFYGTGGLAWGTIEADARIDACWDGCDASDESASIRGSTSDTNVGWTIGAGMEWGWDNWTLGAEYLYVDLGSADFDHRTDVSNIIIEENVELSGDANVDYQFSVIRATAKWKF